MSGEVTCKVCGCVSPLGTAECPDCGAPLPQTAASAAPETAAELSFPPEEGEDAAPAARRPSKKRRLLAGAAIITAVCLLAALAAPLLFPRKEPVPGAVWADGGLVTPDGVWDIEADELSISQWAGGNAYWEGAYWLLSEGGDGGGGHASKLILYGSYAWGSGKYGAAGQTAGDQERFYLFDGQVTEPLEAETVSLTENGVLFYPQADPGGLGFYRRELKTGKTAKLEVLPEEGGFSLFCPSPEGDAIAYRWSEEDGGEGGLRLWTAKSGRVQTLDCPGELWWVGRGGTCFFRGKSKTQKALTSIAQAPDSVDGEDDRCYLWRDGEIAELPGGVIRGWRSADLTEFLYPSDLDPIGEEARTLDEARLETDKWHYYRVGQTDSPVAVDVPKGDYLFPLAQADGRSESSNGLTGCFYTRYGTSGERICYLGEDLTLTDVVDEMDALLAVHPSQRELIYGKDGGVFLVSVDKDGRAATQDLTAPGPDGAYRGGDTVTSFGASEDLKHLYYVAQSDPDDYRAGKTLYHWHDGKTTPLDFTMDVSDGAGHINLTVTPEGGCYFVYRRDAYYTEKDAPPTLLLEEVGSTAVVQLVGPQKWPLLQSKKWEGSENKDHYWYLDGDQEPVELQDWSPEEGTL